jgi:hypothetical protein
MASIAFASATVEVVGSTDVDGVELRIREQILVIAGCALDAQGVGELARRCGSPSCNTNHLYIAEAAQGFCVDAAHETNSKDGYLQLFHNL